MRGFANPGPVAEAACRLAAEELGAERAYWAEVDWTTRDYVIGAAFHLPDAAAVAGRFALDDWEPFTSLQLAGRPSVVEDTQTDARIPPAMREAFARIGVGADLAAPVIVEGRLRCVLAVNQRQPRRWTPEEVALVQAIAGRCWAEVERARAEAATRESEARHRALFESMDEAYAVVEVLRDGNGAWSDFRFLQVNPAFMAHTSMPHPVGRTATELLGAPNPRWTQLYGQALDAGLPLRVQETEPTLGRVFDLNIFTLDRGRNRVAVLFTDITGRVRAEAALRESETRHRLLIESWAQAVWETDASGIVVTDSPSWRAHTGQTLAEWLGYGWLDAIHPDDRAYAERQWREAVAARGLVDAEFRLRAPDGGWRWTNIRAAPVLDAEACVEKWVGMNIDIDAQKRAQLALRESEERQAFLLKLSDALRPVGDPVEIQRTATRLLGEQLKASRVFYVFVEEDGDTATILANYTDGVPNRLGRYSLSAFSSYAAGEWRAGRTASTDDVNADPRWGEAERAAYASVSTRAGFGVPLIKEGRLVALLGVNQAIPRRWTDAETELAREVAERTWAAVERARAEAALRASEARFRGFAENSADVLWITSGDGTRLEYLSPAFERIFGEASDRIMADAGRFLELVHPDDRAVVAGFMPRAVAGETAIAHYRVIRPVDGRVVHLRDTGFPIREAEGAIVRVAGIVQDVSDLQAAAAAREAETERFRTLAEGLPELVWRSGARGSWRWASPQWRDFTGLDDAASRDSGWLAAVHPADRAAASAAWEEAETMGLYQAEYRLRHGRSGQYAWFQTRALPVRNAEGVVLEWIGACSNIEDQVRAREALARGAEELEQRVRERTAELMAAEESLRQAQKMEAIGQLTGGIAHDFNNMLQGVVGGLEMARRRQEQGRGEDAARYMVAARDAAERAAGLTRRLLAFARKQRLEPKAVDADALISGMTDLLRRTVGPAIEIDLKLRDGRWPVLCDPSELEGAVLNLCINGRDAMPDGGRLTIATEEMVLPAGDLRPGDEASPGDYVAIRVVDTGTGMPPEVLKRVLEPFFTTKPQGQGTGLGLSQIYGFTKQSGGLLRIDSAPGRGTAVHILLPRGALEPARTDGPGDATTGGADTAAGGTVLMVDDEVAVRVPAGERLRDLGYRVVDVPDGPTALRMLDEGLRPDLLVSDVGLPNGMDGRAVAEAARQRSPGLPVLFITGYARVALPDDAAVITKPFDLQTLAARIRELLKN